MFLKEVFFLFWSRLVSVAFQTSLCKQIPKRAEFSTSLQTRVRIIGKDTRFDLPGCRLKPSKGPVLSLELGKDFVPSCLRYVPSLSHRSYEWVDADAGFTLQNLLPPREMPESHGGWFTGNVAFPVTPDRESPNIHVVGWLVFMAVGVTDAGTASWTRGRRMSEGKPSFLNVVTPAAGSLWWGSATL